MKEKKEKRSMVVKLRFLPLYWKVVASIVGVFGGGCLAAQLITSSSNFWMIFGFALVIILLWLLINMWLPENANHETKIDNNETNEREAVDSIND